MARMKDIALIATSAGRSRSNNNCNNMIKIECLCWYGDGPPSLAYLCLPGKQVLSEIKLRYRVLVYHVPVRFFLPV